MSEATTMIPAGQPIPEPGVEPDNIDSQSLMIWCIVSVVIVLAFMFGSAALYFQWQNKFNTSRVVEATYSGSEKVLSDQRGVLASYGPPASEGKPYKIPVERAKEIVLAELNAAQ